VQVEAETQLPMHSDFHYCIGIRMLLAVEPYSLQYNGPLPTRVAALGSPVLYSIIPSRWI
jgi:hypothetical protein